MKIVKDITGPPNCQDDPVFYLCIELEYPYTPYFIMHFCL